LHRRRLHALLPLLLLVLQLLLPCLLLLLLPLLLPPLLALPLLQRLPVLLLLRVGQVPQHGLGGAGCEIPA